jgi:hypothetical protein
MCGNGKLTKLYLSIIIVLGNITHQIEMLVLGMLIHMPHNKS